MVGELSPVVVIPSCTSLTSWLISRVTNPPELICGRTDNTTPVSTYTTEVVIAAEPVAPVIVLCPCTGTLDPTLILATWLSVTMIWGEDMTLTLVLLASALKTAETSPPVVRQTAENGSRGVTVPV